MPYASMMKGPGVKCICPDGVVRRARIHPNGRARLTIRKDDGAVAILGQINAENKFIPWAAGKNGRFFDATLTARGHEAIERMRETA